MISRTLTEPTTEVRQCDYRTDSWSGKDPVRKVHSRAIQAAENSSRSSLSPMKLLSIKSCSARVLGLLRIPRGSSSLLRDGAVRCSHGAFPSGPSHLGCRFVLVCCTF